MRDLVKNTSRQGVRKGFGRRCSNWVLRLSLLLQTKENLRAVWKFDIHWTVPCSIALPFCLASSGLCNSSALPSYHGFCGFLMDLLWFLVSPLWFIWTVLPDVASWSSHRSSILTVVPVFYTSSWPRWVFSGLSGLSFMIQDKVKLTDGLSRTIPVESGMNMCICCCFCFSFWLILSSGNLD